MGKQNVNKILSLKNETNIEQGFDFQQTSKERKKEVIFLKVSKIHFFIDFGAIASQASKPQFTLT